jgi:VCBS repeat-containing protein
LTQDQHVTDVFTYTMHDSLGSTSSATLTIDVTGTNDIPTVAAALTDSADEGSTSFTRNLLDGASDVDEGETATLTVADVTYPVDDGAASTAPPAGVSLTGHTLKVDPSDPAFDHLAAGEQTTITVSYNVKDAQGATVSQTETITITGTNDIPTVAAALSDSADEGSTSFTRNLLDGASDVDDGETATLKVTDVTYSVDGCNASATALAGVSLGADGHTLTVDPSDPAFDHLTAGEQSTITVSYNVKDAQGATVSQTETITITGTNEPAAPIVDLNDRTSGLDNVVHHGANSTSPICIAEHSTITDADSTNLVSMKVTLTNPLDNSSGDGGVNVKETLSLTEEAADFATDHGLKWTLSTPTNLNDPITLTITGSAGLADYEAILAGVRYVDTKSGHQDTTDRVITVVVNDGTQDSAVRTTTVTNSNVISGTDAADTLVSTSANDYMTGGDGADNFKFSPHLGNDTVADFTPGMDTITFAAGMFSNHPADVLAATHNDGSGNTVVTIDAHNSITLHNVQKAQLSVSDFHFV